MKKLIALVLAGILLCTAFGTFAEDDGKLDPLFATVGEALDAAGENPVAGGEEDYFAVVTEKDGKYYRSVAMMDEKARELQNATWQAEPDQIEAAFAAANEYVRTLPIVYSEVFTVVPMSQAELDALVGKTVGELREMGFEDRENWPESDESGRIVITYVMRSGMFDYCFAVDADADTYEKALDEWFDGDDDFTVVSVNLRGPTSEACFLRFHTDGTVEEIPDPFAGYTEVLAAFQEMIEKTQNDEEVDLNEYADSLKEMYPNLSEMIDVYLQMYQLLGADCIAAMMNDRIY